MHPDQETIKTPLEDSVNRELSMKLKQQENIITGLPVSTFIFKKKKKKRKKVICHSLINEEDCLHDTA